MTEKTMYIAGAALVSLVVAGTAVAGASGGSTPLWNEPIAQAAATEVGDSREDEGRDEGRDDDVGDADERVTDQAAADRARAAAVKAAGGGTVTEVERADDGESGYEAEVRRSDGSEVEVNLDRAFGVVSVEKDD